MESDVIIVLYFFAKKEGSPSSHLMTFGTPSPGENIIYDSDSKLAVVLITVLVCNCLYIIVDISVKLAKLACNKKPYHYIHIYIHQCTEQIGRAHV